MPLPGLTSVRYTAGGSVVPPPLAVAPLPTITTSNPTQTAGAIIARISPLRLNRRLAARNARSAIA
jgi:hypothetical protein